MKVLQINNFHYLRGGSDKMYLETGKLLEDNGHEVLYFSSKNQENLPSPFEKYFVKPADFFDAGGIIQKVSNAKRFIYNSEAEKLLDALLTLHKPDIAHLHIWQSRLSSAVLKVLKKHNVPTVMSIHEYKLLCPVYTFLDAENKICEKCKSGKFINCAIKKCYKGNTVQSMLAATEGYFRNYFFHFTKYIDRFIMVSRFVNDKHVEFYPQMKDQSVVLYNFIDFKESMVFPERSGYLYFGRLSKEKGIMTLLQTFKDLPDLILQIAGGGELKEEIVKFIELHNMKNVKLLGFLKGEELQRVICQSKFVLVPSEWYEPFSLGVLESLYCGTPVIGTNEGGIPEVVSDGKNGFVFDYGQVESLKKAIGKAEILTCEKYKIMSDNGREFIESNCSKKDYYPKLIKIFQDTIYEKRRKI